MTATVSAPPEPTGWLRRWGPWLAMALVLGAALFVGTVSQREALTNADRLTNIARTVKCPVCSGESVAESNAQISQEIRKDIGLRLEAGQTDEQIREAYRAQYGDYILLTPSSSGVTSLVWILPVALLVVALAGLVVAFSRWRVRGELHASDADRALVADALGEDDQPVAASDDQSDPDDADGPEDSDDRGDGDPGTDEDPDPEMGSGR